MTRNDVNRMFTEKVTELLAQGYQFHTATMSGSQGEYASADLSNGSEVLRVVIERDRSYDAEYNFGDYLVIRVGKCTEKLRNYWQETIWNERLETLSEIKLAVITDNYYTTPEEAVPIKHKRSERYRNRKLRFGSEIECYELSDVYKSIVLRWLQRQPKMKTCKLADIEKVTRTTYSDKASRYGIKAKGKWYILSAREA